MGQRWVESPLQILPGIVKQAPKIGGYRSSTSKLHTPLREYQEAKVAETSGNTIRRCFVREVNPDIHRTGKTLESMVWHQETQNGTLTTERSGQAD